VTAFAAHPALRRHWHAVAGAADVAPGPLGARLLGEDVVVWRAADGVVAAALDVCPHRQSPLSIGQVDHDGGLECPYHGWTFEGSGRCVLVPSSGAGAAVPPKARQATVTPTQRYRLVWLCLDEPAAGLPDVPEDTDPAFRRINTEVDRWAASAPRMVDNFLDIAHFPYVHRGSFGGAAAPEVPSVELGPLGDFHGYAYDVEAANPEVASSASGQRTATVTRRMATGFSLPFLVRSTIDYETGLRHALLLVTTPIDDTTSYFTFVVWRNDDFSVPAEDVIRLDRLIGSEDKAMLTRIPGTLPLDATGLVSVQSDRASVEWKRQLKALLS
jgi:phenylpropionate dioxygenase-like ring-hydroxylating dioxygenase large terminal subunit